MYLTKADRMLLDESIDLFMWDDDDVAFVKFSENEDEWIVYSSSGEEIATVENRDNAFVIAKQNGYIPCSAH